MPSLHNINDDHLYPPSLNPLQPAQFILAAHRRHLAARSGLIHSPAARTRSFSAFAGHRRNIASIAPETNIDKAQHVLGAEDAAGNDPGTDTAPVSQLDPATLSSLLTPPLSVSTANPTTAPLSSSLPVSSHTSSVSLIASPSSTVSEDLALATSSGASETSEATPTSSLAATPSSYTRAPQFYVALILGLLAGVCLILAVVAFFIRRHRRQRRNASIRFPWDPSFSAPHKPVNSELGLDVDDLERRGGVGEPKRSKPFWSTPLSLTSIFNAGDTFNTPATALTNFAGAGAFRPHLASPIPAHSKTNGIPTLPPFVDIALSPALGLQSRHNSSGTLGTIDHSMGELKVANYAPGDSLYFSSESSSRASSALRIPLAEPIQGLPLPHEYGVRHPPQMMVTGNAGPIPTAPERVLQHRHFVESGGEASPSRLVERLRQRHLTPTATATTNAQLPSTNATEQGDGAWADGWRSALSFVSPYLYNATEDRIQSKFTPAPKRLSDPHSLPSTRPPSTRRMYSNGSVYAESVPSVHSISSLKRSNGARKQFVVRGARSQHQRHGRSPRRKNTKEDRSGSVGLGIHGYDKKEYMLFGDAEDEEEESEVRDMMVRDSKLML